MELKILEDNQKPLLSRRELMFEASFDAKTHSRQDFRKSIAENLKANEELVIIKNIDTEFGYRMAKVLVHVYKNKADIEAVEPKYVMKRHEPKEEKKEAAPAPTAPAEGEEAPAEEAPKEEATPEPAAEESVPEEKPAEEVPAELAPDKPAEPAPEGEQ